MFFCVRAFLHHNWLHLAPRAASEAAPAGTFYAVRSRGYLIFVFPDLAHRYGPGPDETWTEMYLVFNGPVFALCASQTMRFGFAEPSG